MSCQIDDNLGGSNEHQIIPETFSEYFGNEISRDFVGTITNRNNTPIAGVTIIINDQSTQTDYNGVFIIKNASVNERFAYVKAEKTGYLHGSRSLVPVIGTNRVSIMLLEANVIGTVNSDSFDTVTLPNGSSVNFDGNFIKEDGSPYVGSVSVIMHHLDPTDQNMPLQMPGMLYAQNEYGAERMLHTLGMLAIELVGDNGEDLNLAQGSVSEIKVPVDISLIGNAPTTIPLWYFDEINGYWKEDGQATLQDNMYVGTVTHFSFWNCDIPTEAITLCVKITDEDGKELNGLHTSISSINFGTTYGYTNINGEVCGFVPINENLQINIYGSGICSDSGIYNETIGPFITDSNISVILPNISSAIETITGSFNTCDGEPVTDGYVQLTYDNQTYTDMIIDSDFEFNLIRCNDENTFRINGRDLVNAQRTGSIDYTFTSPLTNVGTLDACNSANEFIEYNKDGTEWFSVDNTEYITTYLNPNPNGGVALFQINGFIIDGNGGGGSFVFYGRLNEENYIGTYDVMDFNNPNDTGFYLDYMSMSPNNNNIIYNVTSFGEVGDYVDINFSGDYLDYDGNPHTISGIIHVLRDE
jgi:hypothetical protein